MVTSRFRNIHFVGIFFVILLFFLLVFSLVKNGIFEENLGINILAISDKNAALLMIRPAEDLVMWVDLPNNFRARVWKNESVLSLQSAWKFGLQSGEAYKLLEETASLALGSSVARVVKVDGVVTLERLSSKLAEVSLDTDLSLRDRFQIRNYISSSLVSKKFIVTEIPETVFDKITDPDGKEFLESNSSTYRWVKNKLFFEKVLSEDTEVVVINRSKITGMGLALSRELEGVGMKVLDVRADDGHTDLKNGCWFVNIDKNKVYTINTLKNLVGCRELKSDGGVAEIFVK